MIHVSCDGALVYSWKLQTRDARLQVGFGLFYLGFILEHYCTVACSCHLWDVGGIQVGKWSKWVLHLVLRTMGSSFIFFPP